MKHSIRKALLLAGFCLLGALSALRRRRGRDLPLVLGTTLAGSIPPVWIALLLLAYTPVLVLVPLLETLGIGEISPMMAAVGMFCLCNWLICRCFVRKK